jgi:MoxR-like ATPase
VLSGEAIEQMQAIVRKVPVADHVYQTAVRLVRATRPGQDHHPTFVDEMVSWGAGPRASIYLILAAKARAILHGRFHATTEDLAAMALPVLRHRLIPTFNAEAAGKSSDDLVLQLMRALVAEGRRPSAGIAPRATRPNPNL